MTNTKYSVRVVFDNQSSICKIIDNANLEDAIKECVKLSDSSEHVAGYYIQPVRTDLD